MNKWIRGAAASGIKDQGQHWAYSGNRERQILYLKGMATLGPNATILRTEFLCLKQCQKQSETQFCNSIGNHCMILKLIKIATNNHDTTRGWQVHNMVHLICKSNSAPWMLYHLEIFMKGLKNTCILCMVIKIWHYGSGFIWTKIKETDLCVIWQL